MNDVSPWENYGFSKEISVGTDWVYHRYTFEAKVSSENARLAFVLGGEEAPVYIDGASLRKPKMEARERRTKLENL